jgi:hypothetical protein
MYRAILNNLTTTMLDITVFLQKNQVQRGCITRFSHFNTLIDRKFLNAFGANGDTLTKQPELRPEVKTFLDTVGWRLEHFLTTCNVVFHALCSIKSIDTFTRFSKHHAVRLIASTPIVFSVDSKNRARDWDKVILAVVIESAFIETYRKKLIDESPLTRKLRTTLHAAFLKLTPAWRKLSTSDKGATLVTDKKWIFADGIYSDPTDNDTDLTQEDIPTIDHTALRTQFEKHASDLKASSLKKKKSSKKIVSPPIIVSDDDNADNDDNASSPAPDQDQGATSSQLNTAATAKNTPALKKSDDI